MIVCKYNYVLPLCRKVKMARRNQCKKLWILLPSELLVFIGESLVNPNVKNHDLVLAFWKFFVAVY